MKEGIFEKPFSKIIHNIFDLRLGSDYKDFWDVTEKEVKEYLSQAKLLINTIEKYLKNQD